MTGSDQSLRYSLSPMQIYCIMMVFLFLLYHHLFQNFYKDDANREDIYTRYIYRLRDLHLESQDYTEAAFTLMVLAESQDWTDKMLPPDDKHPKQTEMKRKEALYHEIIRLLDKGEVGPLKDIFFPSFNFCL